ncbi:MAG: rhomboid family intramembrane serine protease [Prevotellaceae bacterium]|jgi:membrane associated rhomboid family serine protease|nr:rhomboid family intramembrane serine protease [Prevotellaceae bacterium]
MQYQNQHKGFLNNIPLIVKNLIIINALMLLATELFKPFMVEQFALFYPTSPMFKSIQLFTHMFMHGGIWHLFFNMYALWIFGSVLEQYWGPKRFLTYYLITGLGAAAFYLLVLWLQVMNIESNIDPAIVSQMKAELQANGPEIYHSGRVSIIPGVSEMESWYGIMIIPMLGASGAIYGVLLAFGMMFPNVCLQLLFPPIAMKAKWFVIIFGVIELTLGISQMQGDNVAHFAHLGGMIFGFFMIRYWRKKGGNYPMY